MGQELNYGIQRSNIMPTQKLRVTKKQAIKKEVKRQNPELPDVYIRKKIYKITSKDRHDPFTKDKLSSTEWLHKQGIKQCCVCRAWDKIELATHLCPPCLKDREVWNKRAALKLVELR